MRRCSTIMLGLTAVFAFFVMTAAVQGARPQGDVLEYAVISIEPQGWVVTARETASGDVVKFRLPPAVFKGQTFDANIDELNAGQRFSVRGPRGVRLGQLVVEDPLPPGPPPGRGLKPQPGGQSGETLTWEIVHVDARRWIVTARNRQSHRTAKFRVHPDSFNGFRFLASLRGINKGQGFSIVTPNDVAMADCCTLLEILK